MDQKSTLCIFFGENQLDFLIRLSLTFTRTKFYKTKGFKKPRSLLKLLLLKQKENPKR